MMNCFARLWNTFFKIAVPYITLLSSELWTQTIPKINACCLTLAATRFVLMPQPLFVRCLFKIVHLEGKHLRQVIIFEVSGNHSSLERSLKHLWKYQTLFSKQKTPTRKTPTSMSVLSSLVSKWVVWSKHNWVFSKCLLWSLNPTYLFFTKGVWK